MLMKLNYKLKNVFHGFETDLTKEFRYKECDRVVSVSRAKGAQSIHNF